MVEDDRWRTNNIALATYLGLTFDVLDIQWIEEGYGGGSCYWYFEDSEELADQVADFVGGMASVDPRRYNEAYAVMKREMFGVKDRAKSKAS